MSNPRQRQCSSVNHLNLNPRPLLTYSNPAFQKEKDSGKRKSSLEGACWWRNWDTQ